jgi:hypothetical protein
MKKILITLLCFTCIAGFAQDQIFIKEFPGNEDVVYITHSSKVKGLVFRYNIAADTNKTVFYIPDFKQSDIRLIEQKINIHEAKLCPNNYKSKPGDFIFSFTSKNEMIYFYHRREMESPNSKFN